MLAKATSLHDQQAACCESFGAAHAAQRSKRQHPHALAAYSAALRARLRNGGSDLLPSLFQPQRRQHPIANRGHRQFRPAGAGPSPISSGRSWASVAVRPWLPRTSAASSGTTSNSVRKPSFFCTSRRTARPFGPEQLRIEKQFARVVTRLAVDVHGAGVIRRLAVVEPEGIRKPGIRLGQRDQLAAALVVQVHLLALLAGQDAGNAVQPCSRLAHARA